MPVKFLCLLMSCFSSSVFAGETATPEVIEGARAVAAPFDSGYRDAAGEAVKAGYAGVNWLREALSSWEENGFEVVSGPEKR